VKDKNTSKKVSLWSFMNALLVARVFAHPGP
jgi:hypothetical protein